MSTRCIIQFVADEPVYKLIGDRKEKTCETERQVRFQFYRHSDGYPDGAGIELAEALRQVGTDHNGIECLAASVLALFKNGRGGVYTDPAVGLYEFMDHGDKEYLYVVRLERLESADMTPQRVVRPVIEVHDVYKSETQVFEGGPNELIAKYGGAGRTFAWEDYEDKVVLVMTQDGVSHDLLVVNHVSKSDYSANGGIDHRTLNHIKRYMAVQYAAFGYPVPKE